MELELKHTQQGSSYEVSKHLLLSDIEDSVMDPVTHKFNPPSYSRSLNRLLFHFSQSFTRCYRLSHSESVDIEKVAVYSSLRSLKSKHTIEYRAKRSSKIILLGHYSILLASSYTVKSKAYFKSPTHYPCGIPTVAAADQREITHQILSVISLKTYERYGYTFLKEIALRRADYKECKISEAEYKNLHPNDFEDLYPLHLQGQLNHLSRKDKVHLFNAVSLWIRNNVIRNRVEDLQLRIESYQTKLNLTQPDWDASDFLFKKDYTIVSKPRAVIYRDINDQKKMMRETEVHKFSDGTLNRILDKLDHMVKDFKLYKYNPGLETRILFEDDRRMSKNFMW
nr:hypothetical protein [Tanacetum cinerariifolium]